MAWNEGNGMVGIFSKKLLSMTYCSTVSPSNNYGYFFKKPYFSNKNFGWQYLCIGLQGLLVTSNSYWFLKQQKPSFFQSFFWSTKKILPAIPSLATWSQWGFHCWWLPLVMISVIQGWTMVAQRQKGKPMKPNISKQKRVAGVEGGVAGTACLGGWHNGSVRKESTM